MVLHQYGGPATNVKSVQKGHVLGNGPVDESLNGPKCTPRQMLLAVDVLGHV